MLFCVINRSAFTDHADFNLSRIFQLCLDLFCNISCQKNHISIADLFRNYHDTNLSSCLDSKRFVYSLEGVGNIF